MKRIKKIRKIYLKWFVVLNLVFVSTLLAMNLFYNFILGKNLWSTVFFTGLSAIAIYSLAASFIMMTSRRWWKLGVPVALLVVLLLLYTSNRAIFDILPQWGDPAYESANRPSWKHYALIMGPRLFYYSFIAMAIALNIRLGMMAIRKMKTEIEKVEAEQTADAMELRAWGAYTNPHFLKNELVGMGDELLDAETYKKRQYLKRRLDLLVDITTYNSENALYDRRTVVFGKELRQLRNYLESRDIGSEDYLKPVLEVEGESAGHKIVPMTLVYLAEGAFKHGDLRYEPLIIRLWIFPDRIEIAYRNRIPTEPREVESMGSGLATIKRRLELAMPGRFEWKAEPSGLYFEVAITIYQK